MIKHDIKHPGSAFAAWIKLAECGSSGGPFFNATLLYSSVYTMMHHELRVLIVSSLAIPVAPFMRLC